MQAPNPNTPLASVLQEYLVSSQPWDLLWSSSQADGQHPEDLPCGIKTRPQIYMDGFLTYSSDAKEVVHCFL